MGHRGVIFDCCTERYEIVVLLPNSEQTKGNNMKLRDADAPTVRLRGKTFINNGGYKHDLVTSLFVIRNIKCGYTFS